MQIGSVAVSVGWLRRSRPAQPMTAYADDSKSAREGRKEKHIDLREILIVGEAGNPHYSHKQPFD